MKNLLAAIIAVIFFISAGNVNAAIPKPTAWQPEVLIGLLGNIPQVTLKFSAPCVMTDTLTKKELQKISADKYIDFDVASLQANSIEIRGDKIALKNLQVSVNGKTYFGGIKILKKGSTMTVINIAPVEEYLCGVVPNEMIQSWNLEALKAQAVAARTFVLKNRHRHKSEGYELCTTTHCQVYDGTRTFANTNMAITMTYGEVLYQGGRTVDAPFHADSGGMTESAENVWGKNVAHLQAVAEDETKTQAWTVKFKVNDFSARMGSAFGNLQSFKLTPLTIGKSAADRTTSGRVKTFQIIGSKKTVTMKSDEARRKFSLPSTLFDVKIENGEAIFSGYGKGHGVGLSQYGAKHYAEQGWTYDKILAHYYRGATIKKLY